MLTKLNVYFSEDIIKYIINKLGLTIKKINELKEYKHFDDSKILLFLQNRP